MTAPAVDLAHEADFRLGPLLVRPSRRETGEGPARNLLEPRVMQVLVALARQPDDVVSRDDLIASCWAGRIVGDDAINNCVAKVRRVGEASGAFRIETIPRVGYRLTPVGGAIAAPTAPRAPDDGVLLAAVPFDNLSPDPELAYFSEGVTEEILHILSQRGGLKVIGRASSFQFRGPDKSIPRISRELGATHVLDGSARRSGRTVRISAQLIECAGQTTVWADRFDRELEDVLALQDEIAAAVADALHRTLVPGAVVALDPVVHDAYLRARGMILDLVAGPATLELLAEVTRRAPDFAPGWVAAADARLQVLAGTSADWRHVEGEAAERLLAEAGAAVARAQMLAPDAPDTLRIQLLMAPVCPDWTQLERSLLAARARWPNDAALLFDHGRLLLQVGRQTDAIPALAEAYRLDPLHAAAASAYASALRAADRTAEAVGLWTDLVRRFPSSPQPYFSLVFCLAGAGDWEAVDTWITPDRLARFPEDSERVRNVLFAVSARRQGGAEMRAQLIGLANMAAARSRLPLSFAAVLSEFCDLDWLYGILAATSFDDLRRPGGRLDAGDGSLEVLFLPEFQRLRSDPRFAHLCAKLGFASYWMETDRWPDCAKDVAAGYDFKAECARVSPA
ncbi:winged helix-turn-helix domain-containing protein [Phenylobacterium sp.]|uniref:winged helix-turn-helix domain-containing protein n=1 Tax=Phenylobacterium sp. TaxID=1871053 RepID=UPI0025FC81E1|nr:winged helix-turn-helix domain-containing protein [Phenylobacterium sp.]